jgi:hypothetical protein
MLFKTGSKQLVFIQFSTIIWSFPLKKLPNDNKQSNDVTCIVTPNEKAESIRNALSDTSTGPSILFKSNQTKYHEKHSEEDIWSFKERNTVVVTKPLQNQQPTISDAAVKNVNPTNLIKQFEKDFTMSITQENGALLTLNDSVTKGLKGKSNIPKTFVSNCFFFFFWSECYSRQALNYWY